MRPITAEMAKALMALLSPKFGGAAWNGCDKILAVARRKKNRYFLQARMVEDRLLKQRVKRIITKDGRIVPRVAEVNDIVKKYALKHFRPNRVVLYHKIARRYCAISLQRIQDILNKMEPVQPIFDNSAPLIPISAKDPMDRLQIDLVMLRTKENPINVLSILEIRVVETST